MKLIDREFLAAFFKTYLVLVFFFSLLHLAETLLDQFDNISRAEENGLYWACIFFIYSLPRFYVESGVVAVAASILWNVTTRARNNEILAYMAGGISPRRLALPLIAGSFIVSIGILALSQFVVPQAETTAEYIEGRWLKGKDETELLRSDDVFQRGSGRRMYIIDQFVPATDTMLSPTIVDLQETVYRPSWIIRAQSAALVRDGEETFWRFERASLREWDEETGELIGYEFFDSVTDRELERPLEPQLERFLSNLGDPEKMNFFELRDHINLLDAQGKPVAEYRQWLHTKLALPLGVAVIALVICGHVLRARAQGMVADFGGGLAWIAGYYALFLAFEQIGAAELAVSSALFVWFPNIVYTILGGVLLMRGGS